MAYLQLVLVSPFLLYGLLRLLWGLLRWRVLRVHSGFLEIENLNKTSQSRRLNGTAVVCGGSIAGLLTSRVCHDFFDRVIIVEPEEWLTGEDGVRRFSWEQEHSRSRIMQYHSLHGNIALLYRALDKLFPSFEEHCAYSGIKIRPANAQFTYAGIPIASPLKSYSGQLPRTLQSGRRALETLLRRLVLSQERYPRIEQIAGTIIGITPSPNDRSFIRSVRIRHADKQITELDAAMVVDCTGATRAGAKCLSQAGYGAAETSSFCKFSLGDAKITMDQKLHYTTLTCNISPDTWAKLPTPSDQKLEYLSYMFSEELPERGRRMFTLLRIEANQLVLFAGQCTNEPRKYESLDAMRSFLHSLVPLDPKHPIPNWIFGIIDILEETETPITFSYVRVPPTSYIRYHRTVDLPRNFVAMGDSVMSRCTKAVLGALALHSTLYRNITNGGSGLPLDFSESFFKEHFNKTDHFWQATRLLDYGVPTTEPVPGEDLRSGELVRGYLRKLRVLSIKDEHARRVLYDNAQSLGSSVDIFHPWLVLRVIWMTLGDKYIQYEAFNAPLKVQSANLNQ